MPSLRDYPIKWKLRFIVMATCGIALGLACAALFVFDVVAERREMINNVGTIAEAIAANSTAALAFHDRPAANEILRALRLSLPIVSAGIFDGGGKPFAKYLREGTRGKFPVPTAPGEGYRFEEGYLVLYRPILLDRERIGTVYIQSDMRELEARLQFFGYIVVLILAVTAFVAFLLSSRLQRLISDPILELERLMNRVSKEKDYNLRAVQTSRDEVGSLMGGFNHMLTQIQDRDAALLQAQAGLEARVDARTKALQQEVAERARAEEDLRRNERQLRELLEGRERINQDLHDGILQSLYAFGLSLEECKLLLKDDPGLANRQLEHTISQLNLVMGDVRNFIAGLESDILRGGNLDVALKSLIHGMHGAPSTAVRVRIDPVAARSLPAEAAVHLLHITREVVSNSLRHAAADSMDVSMQLRDGGVRYEIRDNGVGFDLHAVETRGHGLSNMMARARKMDWNLEIVTGPGRGTQVIFDLTQGSVRAER
jgi:signal transduction histidine kinase